MPRLIQLYLQHRWFRWLSIAALVLFTAVCVVLFIPLAILAWGNWAICALGRRVGLRIPNVLQPVAKKVSAALDRAMQGYTMLDTLYKQMHVPPAPPEKP